MRLTEISLAVVKGTRLTHPDAAELDAGGVRDDRRFHVVAVDGRQRGATRGALTQVRAGWEPDARRLSLTLPGGETVEGAAELAGPLAGSVPWDRGRRVEGREVAGPFSAALSDHLGEAVRLVEAAAPALARDVAPVTLLGTASVARLEADMGVPRLGTRRFRLNLTFDGAAAYAEDGWYGRELTVGGARLRVTGPVPRCVVVTHDPDTGARDHAVLKGIVRTRGAIVAPDGERVDAPFGVYAEVVEPGRVAVGDAVTLGG